MQRLEKIAHRFRKQEEFTQEYAPLYAHLFGLLADWCTHPYADLDPVVSWLLDASAGRKSFDVPLLLLAGLHRDVLAGEAEMAELATYYPTAGGRRSVENDTQRAVLADVLRTAILARREALYLFIQTARVQTNETGRGLCWLLPLAVSHWPAVHLLDLGASAGLNLVADQRAYRFISANTQARLLDLGQGIPEQFVVACRGETEVLQTAAEQIDLTQIKILSRSGADIAPFTLETPEAEMQLMSYIWADHPERLARLREGIAALRAVNEKKAAVQLHAVDLPHGLSDFLERLPHDQTPLIIYNTYITRYFPSEAEQLSHHISTWAERQSRPVLWLQWEPFLDPDQQARAPHFGWCAWTADVWQAGVHAWWHFGWVHPHGTRLKLLPHFRAWVEQWAALD